MKREAFALKCFAGCGAVKLLAADEGMLLLEQAMPAISLKSYFPDKEMDAIHIACKVMKKLHQAEPPESNNFPHIKDWLWALDKEWDLPSDYLQNARKLRDHLFQTAGPDILLHGDLHHDNILKNGEDWIVIDPKGVMGDPAYEVGAFIRNPIPDLIRQQKAREIIQNRIPIFSDSLDISPSRISDWCFVQAVLAWIWALEDGCDTLYWAKVSEIFDGILRI